MQALRRCANVGDQHLRLTTDHNDSILGYSRLDVLVTMCIYYACLIASCSMTRIHVEDVYDIWSQTTRAL